MEFAELNRMFRAGLTEKVSKDLKKMRILTQGILGTRAFQVVGMARAKSLS